MVPSPSLPSYSPKDLSGILDRLFQKDQSDWKARSFSRGCYEELKSIEHVFKGTDFERDFHYRMSVFALHEAQRHVLMLEEVNPEQGRHWMKLALGHAVDCAELKVFDEDEHWSYYIEGSLAYLEGDVQHAHHCVTKCDDENVPILKFLAEQLEATGEVNYKRDFTAAPRRT